MRAVHKCWDCSHNTEGVRSRFGGTYCSLHQGLLCYWSDSKTESHNPPMYFFMCQIEPRFSLICQNIYLHTSFIHPTHTLLTPRPTLSKKSVFGLRILLAPTKFGLFVIVAMRIKDPWPQMSSETSPFHNRVSKRSSIAPSEISKWSKITTYLPRTTSLSAPGARHPVRTTSQEVWISSHL